MAYEKSVINIDINFDNEGETFLKPPKPVFLRKVPKDRITTFQPSADCKKTSLDIQKRVQELHKFRQESQSALKAPLLVTALVKKTHERLNTILEPNHSNLTALEKFIWASRVVHVLVSSCMRWRRYKKPDSGEATDPNPRPGARKGSQKSNGIGFDSRNFKGKSKISDELRHILTSLPRARTSEGLRKVQRLCRSTRAFMIFPLEREADLARVVAYERYDNGRVIACQERLPERFYYVLSGRVSKVCVYDLAAGVTKMAFGELMQGSTTESAELMNGTAREHSLICKGPVEVLVLDREDFMELMNTSPNSGLPIEMLRSFELFCNFPLDKFFDEKDAIMTKYFPKESVIVKDSSDSNYFYIVKSGRCKVARQQDVLDIGKTPKLPRITTVAKRSPRSTPGKNPGSLLELTHSYSIYSMPRPNKANSRPRKPMKPKQKFLGESGTIVSQDDFNQESQSVTIETCDCEVSKRQEMLRKKLSEVSMSIPTRTALLQIAVLKPGDMFGIESMMAKVTSKISPEADVAEENPDPSSKSLILISEGAECIMVNKRFFLMNASTTTLVQLKAIREEYMTVEDARLQIQSQQSWDLYKADMVKTLATKKTKYGR